MYGFALGNVQHITIPILHSDILCLLGKFRFFLPLVTLNAQIYRLCNILDRREVSLKERPPLYIVGVLLILIEILYLSYFSVGYFTIVSVFVLIVAGLVLYLGWVLHFDKDKKEFDNGNGGGGIFLEKPPTPS
jgi:hypothetical protein